MLKATKTRAERRTKMENANDKNSMGRIIAAKRKELSLTQEELAKKLGVTDKAVSKWERDLSCPDIASLPRLAEILGTSTDELLQAKAEADGEKPAAAKAAALLPLVCKAVTLAMGVAVVVLSALGELETGAAVAMLGVGLTAAGVALLNQK